jgi:hypothetical protein
VQVLTRKEHFQFVARPPKVVPLPPAAGAYWGSVRSKKIAANARATEELRTMTANQATYAAILAMDGASSRRANLVRAQVGGCEEPASCQNLEIAKTHRPEGRVEQCGPHLLADTRGARPRGPHPCDVLYWVACLGGACLLLLSATT